jgi:hypothetical protein
MVEGLDGFYVFGGQADKIWKLGSSENGALEAGTWGSGCGDGYDGGCPNTVTVLASSFERTLPRNSLPF